MKAVMTLAVTCAAVLSVQGAMELSTSADRVESPLRVNMRRVGTLAPRGVKDIRGSNWTLGCETLDRDFALVGGTAGVLGEGPWRLLYERPGDSFETRPAVFNYAGAPLEDPVWVDLLTGRVYEFSKRNATAHSSGVTFVNVPVYDSPCLLTERRVVLP